MLAEAVAVSGVRGVKNEGASCSDGLGLSAVYDVRGQQAEAGMTVMLVVGVEEVGAEPRASAREANLPGKLGQYFKVLNCASL